MANSKLVYSPVILLTGAGCSVPYGLPDMRGFAKELHEKLQREGIPQPTLDLVGRILYGTPTPDKDSVPVSDLEGLLVGLTSVSQYPASDNPAVSYLMDIGSEATNELSHELSSLLRSATTLTDLIPRNYLSNPSQVNAQGSEVRNLTVQGAGGIHFSDGLEQARSQADVVTEAASDARDVLAKWQGAMDGLREHASKMLDRVKTSISGRYSTADPQRVDRLFGPLFETLISRCDGFLDLFTLNYDPTIEIFCQTRGVPISTGFESNGLEKVWQDAWEFSATPSIHLHKLHGSVTWYTYEEKIIELGAGFGHQSIPTLTGTPAYNMLIYPIVAKPIWSEPYLSLFAHLSEALNKALCCIVVGFSYRDDPVVSALHHACSRNSKLKILHCGMTKEAASHIEQLKPLMSRIQFMNSRYGDEDFIQELNRELFAVLP